MKRELTCIICPLGCSLTAEMADGEVRVSGNTCPKGAEYAKTECTNPVRTVTASVKCDGGMLSVKTDRPIKKGDIFLCMEKIHSLYVKAPVSIGDVICENVCGANIVATQNRK